MAVYALWYGGPSYSNPSGDEDVEVFATTRDARWELYRRYAYGYGYVRSADTPGEEKHVLFPAVSPDCELLILEFTPAGIRKNYNPGVAAEPVERWTLIQRKDGMVSARVKAERF